MESRAGRAAAAAAAERRRWRRWRSRRPRAVAAARRRSPARPKAASQGLSQSQAEQILSSMERRERETRDGAAAAAPEWLGRGSEGLVTALWTRLLVGVLLLQQGERPQLDATVDADHVSVGEEIAYTLRAVSHSQVPDARDGGAVQRTRDHVAHRAQRGVAGGGSDCARQCSRSGSGPSAPAAGSSARRVRIQGRDTVEAAALIVDVSANRAATASTLNPRLRRLLERAPPPPPGEAGGGSHRQQRHGAGRRAGGRA